MIPRVPEPEVMDDAAEAAEYDSMDHSVVNDRFVTEFLNTCGTASFTRVVDVGAGTGLIPLILAAQCTHVRIDALDRSEAMLSHARQHFETHGVADRVTAVCCDSRELPFETATFDAAMSNSLFHHLVDDSPDAMESVTKSLGEMVRVVRSGGLVFIRDLCRPASAKSVEQLVATYAGAETLVAQQLFRQSLHAAFTVAEISEAAASVPFASLTVEMTSDRHWTLIGRV